MAAATTQFRVIVINTEETSDPKFKLSFNELNPRTMMGLLQGGIIYEIHGIIMLAFCMFFFLIYLCFKPKNMVNASEVDDNFIG